MEKGKTRILATLFAILAAALYAINVPMSKVLLEHVQPTMMAAFLYLGAGVGSWIYDVIVTLLGKKQKQEHLTKKELPYTIAMVLLDIAAPIFLMMGILRTNSANVSLLNNFEIVATSIIALVIFKEVISKRLWFAIVLVIISSVLLSFEGDGAFVFNEGSLYVLGACICWGFENNCTKMISNKSSTEIVTIKGIFSGLGSLIIGIVMGETVPELSWLAIVLVLGFVSYGLSINFYIKAQKDLGAAKTSAYYSVAPFLGVLFSIVLVGERPQIRFFIAFFIMIVATIFMILDSIALQHTHEHMHTHTHAHSHGEYVHVHEHSHIHSHQHVHEMEEGEHSHVHNDKELYAHEHTVHNHSHDEIA